MIGLHLCEIPKLGKSTETVELEEWGWGVTADGYRVSFWVMKIF